MAAVVEAALELLRKHLPPALLVVAAPSSSSSQQQQQQQAQQRLTRVVLGVSGFQVCALMSKSNPHDGGGIKFDSLPYPNPLPR